MNDNDVHALSLNAMPDAAHAAAMRVCRKFPSKRTPYTYMYSYLLLLATAARHGPFHPGLSHSSILAPDVVDRFIEEATSRMSSCSIANTLRNIVGFSTAAFDDEHDVQFIRDRAQVFEAKAKREPGGRYSYAIDETEIPFQFTANFDRLRETSYPGEFLRYLGAQRAAGFDLNDLTADQLCADVHVAAFISQRGGQISAQSLNSLACALQAADFDARPLFRLAAEKRRENSPNAGSYERRSDPFENLPNEIQKRFEFVIDYKSGATFADIDGRHISLPKAQTRDRRDYSENHIKCMKLALRMHYTILKEHDEAFASDLESWKTPEAFRLHQIFYAGSSFVTQASRLEELIAALGAIFGDIERKLFPLQRRQIRLLNAVAAKVAQPVVVPDLPIRIVRRRSLAIARKALSRWRDLRTVDNPYRDPIRLAGLIRTAMIVAILSELPLRLRTMTLLTPEFIRKNGNAFDIVIPGKFMKNRKPYYRKFSIGLSRMIGVWLSEVRPFLAGPNAPVSLGFFVSNHGNTASRIVFQRNVPEFMEAFFKESISMHEFRNLHASELAEDTEEARFRLQQIWGESQKPYRGAKQARDVDRTSSLIADSGGIFDFKLGNDIAYANALS